MLDIREIVFLERRIKFIKSNNKHAMEINQIESNLKSINEILTSFNKANSNRDKYEMGYNIFDIISKNFHHENFHSQIIFSILNPNSKHKDGGKYLSKFIDYLNKVLSFNKMNLLSPNEYKNCNVTIEHPIEGNNSIRRIDILLVSKSNKAIIIENKINNAKDMYNQIPSYYNWCVSQGYTVEGIIYLTLDGYKSIDESTWTGNEKEKREIKQKLINIKAFDITKDNLDLYHGWLQDCIELSGQNFSVKVILEQYSQLLRYLRKYIMEETQIKALYEKIMKNPVLGDAIYSTQEIMANIPIYFISRILNDISYKSPFIEHKKENNGLIFKNIRNTEYCMYVHLESYKNSFLLKIRIHDRNEKYLQDEKLKEFFINNHFTKKYDGWNYELKQFSSINELINEEKNIVILINNLLSELYVLYN